MELKSKDLDNFRKEGTRGIEDLAKMAELMGYDSVPKQMQLNNRCHVSSLLYFFEDNPGAVEAVHEWVREQYVTEIEENDNPEDDAEED